MATDRKPKITLTDWATARYSPAPSAWVLRAWVRDGQIYPVPEKVGRSYYVEQDARRINPDAPRLSLVQRLELEGQEA
jgi:hypothetical protein